MRTTTLLVCMAALGLGGCDTDDWGPDALARGKGSRSADQLARGRAVYGDYCAGCHGESGDGQGQAARFLDPKPRDFRVGRIKFAAVQAGEAPREDDYLRVIEHGLSGTSMPRFDLLAKDEKEAVIAYIRSFYTDWVDDPPGGPVSPGADPWVDDRAGGVEMGKLTYYGLAKCWSCHPAYETKDTIAKLHVEAEMDLPELRPNLYAAEVKESKWGADIKAPDFLVDDLKTGFEVAAIARVVASGVGGTAMPTWAGVLEPEQIWGIAYYVNDIALKRETPEGRALEATLTGAAAQ